MTHASLLRPCLTSASDVCSIETSIARIYVNRFQYTVNRAHGIPDAVKVVRPLSKHLRYLQATAEYYLRLVLHRNITPLTGNRRIVLRLVTCMYQSRGMPNLSSSEPLCGFGLAFSHGWKAYQQPSRTASCTLHQLPEKMVRKYRVASGTASTT